MSKKKKGKPADEDAPTLLRVVDNLGHAKNHAMAVKLAILGDHYNPAGDFVGAGEAMWCLIDHHIDMLKRLEETAVAVLRAQREGDDEED